MRSNSLDSRMHSILQFYKPQCNTVNSRKGGWFFDTGAILGTFLRLFWDFFETFVGEKVSKKFPKSIRQPFNHKKIDENVVASWFSWWIAKPQFLHRKRAPFLCAEIGEVHLARTTFYKQQCNAVNSRKGGCFFDTGAILGTFLRLFWDFFWHPSCDKTMVKKFPESLGNCGWRLPLLRKVSKKSPAILDQARCGIKSPKKVSKSTRCTNDMHKWVHMYIYQSITSTHFLCILLTYMHICI